MFSWYKKHKLQTWLIISVIIGKLYDIFIAPIVNINIERWAESKDYDDELVDGGQQVKQFLSGALEWIDWAFGFLTNPYFIGFVIGTAGLGIFQILMNRYGAPKNSHSYDVFQASNNKIPDIAKSILKNPDLKNYAVSTRDDFDLIPLELIVRCKRSDDGLDIRGIIQFRNRGTKPVFLKIVAIEFLLNDETAKFAGISVPIPSQTSQSIQFSPIRVYNEKGHIGSAVFAIKFGLSNETMRSVLLTQYNFKIISYAPDKSTDFVCELEIKRDIQYLTKIIS